MSFEEIKFSEEDWDKFYEIQGANYFQLESSILKAHGEDQKKLLYEIFGSTKTLVQTIGVVAGFGFTGLGYVENLSLFIGGEFFLFVAIIAGSFWSQKTYKTNFESYRVEVSRTKKLFSERYAVFKKIYDKALSDIGSSKNILIPKSQIVELQKQDNDLMSKFAKQEDKKNSDDPFGWLMLFFAIGGLLLLLSFVHLCLF